MPTHALTIAPNHKAIERYYEELTSYNAHYATYEQATRAAFEHLLSALASQVIQAWF